MKKSSLGYIGSSSIQVALADNSVSGRYIASCTLFFIADIIRALLQVESLEVVGRYRYVPLISSMSTNY